MVKKWNGERVENILCLFKQVNLLLGNHFNLNTSQNKYSKTVNYKLKHI